MWRQLVKNGETQGSNMAMAIYDFSAEMKTQLYNKIEKTHAPECTKITNNPQKNKKHTPGPNHIQQVHHTHPKKDQQKTQKEPLKNHMNKL